MRSLGKRLTASARLMPLCLELHAGQVTVEHVVCSPFGSQCLVGLKPDLPRTLAVGLQPNSSMAWQCIEEMDV